jgi:hypothetical protein
LRRSASRKPKYELAERHRYDWEAYTDAKGPFVERVLDERRARKAVP